MFALTTLKILASGFMAFLFQKNRLAKSWAFVLFIGVAAVIATGFHHFDVFQSSLWYVPWIKTPALNLNLGLKTGGEFAPFILGGSAVLLYSLYYNIFYPLERDRLRAGGLYAFIFVLLMFILSAGNMMQLFLSLCLLDVLIFILISEWSSKRLFLAFNLTADALLFVLFAFVWGQENSLYFSALKLFSRHCSYPELVFWLWFVAVSIKCGLAFFHNYLLELKAISFVRQNFVAVVTVLLSGVVLFYKTFSLTSLVPYGALAFQILAAVSLLWALIGSLVSDYLKARILYFYMMLSALLVALIVLDRNNFLSLLLPLLAVGGLMASVMILPLIAAANEPLVSHTGGFARAMMFSLFVSLVAFVVEIWVFLSLINSFNQWWIVAFVLCHFIAFSHFLGQVYFGDVHADERVWAVVKNPPLIYFIPFIVLGVGLGMFCCDIKPIEGILSFSLLLFFSWKRPLCRYEFLEKTDERRDVKPLLSFYEKIFLTPLRLVGRVLWLTVDFLFVERVMVALLRRLIVILIRTSMFLHQNMRVCGWFFLLFGLGYAAAVFFWQKGAF